MYRMLSPIATLALALLVAAGAWAGGETDQPAPAAATDVDTSVMEAPALAALVASGELPPLAERIPDEPLVITPRDELGRYGGTLRRAWRGPSDGSNVKRLMSQRLVRFTPDVSAIIPNLATGFDVSDGGREFIFHLRPGTRWSDGDEFSAEDFTWWYDNIFTNTEITPRPWSWLTVAGEPVKVDSLDDYTVRFRFKEPYGLFTAFLSASQGFNFILPSHFLQQFHPDFADADELAAMMKEAGVEEWTRLIGPHLGGRRIYTPGDPSLSAWLATNDPASTRLVMERNPYFWWVDTAGRQLPYIDRVTFELVTDREVINLKASAGELDFQFRHLSPTNFTLFKENEERGGYRTLTYIHDREQDGIISINLSNKDPDKRAVVSDPRFRKAMSYALNRNDINELVYGGLAGIPSQAQPFPESPFHLPELAAAYVDYDPDKANALLDEMGLSARDGKGFRLGLNGEPFSLTLEITDNFSDLAELTREYWQAVGVKTNMKVIERSLWQERYETNDMDVSMWGGSGGMMPLTWPRYYVPTGGQVLWAPAWQHWYESGGVRGEEPPEYVKQGIALYEEIKLTVDPEKQHELFKDILRLKLEHLWDIGTLSPPTPIVGVVNAKMRNVPERAPYSAISRSPGSFQPEQFFYVN